MNSLLLALPLLKDDGVAVIEDIFIEDLPVWQTAFALLNSKYDCNFVQTKSACVVVVQKKQ